MRNFTRTKIIFYLSILGFFIAGFSLYEHVKPVSDGICNISEVINCDIINKSIYSEMAGIPVALLGMLFYAVLIWFSYFLAFDANDNRRLEKVFLYTAGFGVIYSLSLGTFVFYKLHAICPICVMSYITVIVIFILSFKLRLSS